MKTVIQVVQHLSPGGIEVMALELKKCNEKNARMLIISLEGNKKQALEKWPRLSTIAQDLVFMNKQPGFDISLARKLARLFIAYRAEAIHTHHIGPLIYGGLAARLAGIKTLVHTEHDAWHLQNKKRRLIERTAVLLLRPTLVADADSVAQGMRHFLRKKSIEVIKNGIDLDLFCPGNKHVARQRLGLPAEVPLVGCSGRLETVKGQAFLLRALAKLDDKFHLAIAGDGSLRNKLTSLAADLGIERRVHFLGPVDDMPTFYRALDLFCLPSLREGLPLAPLEAQACGIPAIVTDTGGAGETLCPSSGMLVTPGNCEELALAIKSQFARKTLGNNGHDRPRAFVTQQGNIDCMAKAYARLCRIDEEVVAC